MVVKSSFEAYKRVVSSLSVNDGYDGSERLRIADLHVTPGAGVEAVNTAHYMSGFCLMNETFSSQKEEIINFDISGNCFVIVIFYDGRCLVRDMRTDEAEPFEAGMIRSLSFEDGSWQLVIPAGQSISYLSIILSHKFLSKLIQTETWADVDSSDPAGAEYNVFSRDRLAFVSPAIRNILYQFINPVYNEHYRRSFFELKLRELIFLINMQDEETGTEKRFAPEIYHKVCAAKAYLIEHYVDNPTIAQLAREVSLNEFSLKTHFKSMFGTTIHRFITQLRMESASQMLLEDRFVADVAASTGYQSVSHFISVYKKHYGRTPKRASLITVRK